ncbi:MAG TPA: ABC transporter ATP-binding protein [Thermoanaerobaculia bacterium]|nr:ABC transporter ATP-binding protein [Thermoanaerobaculia bacterium]
MSDELVRVESLTVRYGDQTAVDRLSFDVRRGEMFGLIGPDGAGKTSTLRALLGLLVPASGTLATCGLEPRRDRRQLASRVGYLSQRFSLYGDLTVDENIAFFAEVHGVRGWKPSRDRLLEMVRMTPFRRRLADRLSGGMKQKLALACTLIHTPELLVLDEPTTGVDPVSRRDFWQLLGELRAEGLTLLLTTPYLDEAERCQRVALVHEGRLLALDDPNRLREGAPGVLFEVVARPRREAIEALSRQPGIDDVEVFGERIHAYAPSLARAAGSAEAENLSRRLSGQGLEVLSLQPVLPSLEDLFIQRIRSEAQP